MQRLEDTGALCQLGETPSGFCPSICSCDKDPVIEQFLPVNTSGKGGGRLSTARQCSVRTEQQASRGARSLLCLVVTAFLVPGMCHSSLAQA